HSGHSRMVVIAGREVLVEGVDVAGVPGPLDLPDRRLVGRRRRLGGSPPQSGCPLAGALLGGCPLAGALLGGGSPGGALLGGGSPGGALLGGHVGPLSVRLADASEHGTFGPNARAASPAPEAEHGLVMGQVRCRRPSATSPAAPAARAMAPPP